MSDATSISWGSDTSLAFTAGDLGHISSEFSGPPVSAVVRQGANFEFANVLAPLKYLAFTNATRIFATNTCSGASNPFVIEIQSGSGTPTNPTASTVIRVTSNSSGAVVYSDSNCDTPVTNGDFTFETNQSSKTFYVRDTTRGSYTLTGTRQSGDSVISGTHIYGLTIDPLPSSSSIVGGVNLRGGTTIR